MGFTCTDHRADANSYVTGTCVNEGCTPTVSFASLLSDLLARWYHSGTQLELRLVANPMVASRKPWSHRRGSPTSRAEHSHTEYISRKAL